MRKPIKRLPKEERPREKLLARGAAALSDRELLAAVLGKGTTRMDVMTLAEHIVRLVDSRGMKLRADDLREFAGMGDAKVAQVLAAIEFVRRRIKPAETRIAATADILPLIRHYADRKQEHFLAITLNGANEVLNIRVISIGLVDRSQVHPREVFADAIADRASGIIVAHNHPSGKPAPSKADHEITRQLQAAGEVVGILLLDHIIFNRSEYYSFVEAGNVLENEP